jgi:hypothetical protein
MKKKSQYSTEAIIILSLLLFIILTIISFREELLFSMSNSYYSAKARTTSDLILQTAELVYHQGSGARSVIFVSIPKEVVNITLSNNILVINMNISDKITSIFRTVPFNFNGTIPSDEGNYCLELQSYSGYVEVNTFNGTC